MARIFTGAVVAPSGLNADYLNGVASQKSGGAEALSRIGSGIVEATRNYRDFRDSDQAYDEVARKAANEEADRAVAEAEREKADKAFQERVAKVATIRQNAGDDEWGRYVRSDTFDIAAEQYIETGDASAIQNGFNAYRENEREKERIGKQKEEEAKVAKQNATAEGEDTARKALRQKVASVKKPFTKKAWSEVSNPGELYAELESLYNEAVELDDQSIQNTIMQSLTALAEGEEVKGARNKKQAAIDAENEDNARRSGAMKGWGKK